MKRIRKILAAALTVALVLSLSAIAFADAPAGSVTIKGTADVPVSGKTFNAYKILDATRYVYNPAEPDMSIAYSVPAEMKSFYLDRYSDLTGDEPNFGQLAAEKIAAEVDLFAFAADALAAAKTAGVEPLSASAGEGDESVVISDMPFGYYVIEDVGPGTPVSALMLDTAGDVEITIKADKPGIDKVIVNADSAIPPETDGKGTAQDVGSVAGFKLVSRVPDMTGYSSYTYVVHDVMSAGLTFNDDVVVTIGDATLASGIDYVVNKNGQSFDIVFNDFINQKANVGNDIVITYSATLNEHALITNVETNTVRLEYSNNPNVSSSTETTPDKIAYVYDFDIYIFKTDPDHPTVLYEDIYGPIYGGLAGAEFILYKKVGDAPNEVKKYYKWNDADKKVEWVDEETEATKTTTNENGRADFKGLDSGAYWLQEIKAPDGYNLLTEDVAVNIVVTYNDDGRLDATHSNCNQTITVENHAGSELPSTGGIGVTIFYIIGSLLAIGAFVLLVVKKRMAREQ